MPETALIYDPDAPSDARAYAAGITRELPALKAIAAGTIADAIAAASEATILVAKAQDIGPALVAAIPTLRWIHALTPGADPLLALDLPPTGIVTSARGLHGPQVA